MSRRKIPGKWGDNADGTRSYVLTYTNAQTGKPSTKRFHEHKGGKPAAEAFYDQNNLELRAGTYTDRKAGQQTFVAYAEEWALAQDWAPSTRETFRSQVSRFERLIGKGRRLDQVDEPLLLRLRANLASEYATNVANITLSHACAIMRSAYRNRLVSNDVTVAVTQLKNRTGQKPGPGVHGVPSRAEVVAIIEAAPDNWRAAITLGASGLRVSEVLGTHHEQFDRDTGVFVVDRQLQTIDGVDSFKLPKREKIRTIVLPDFAREALETHLDDHQGRGLLFRNVLGAPRRRDMFYTSVWRPTLEAAGVGERRYTFHALRHWAASSMLAAGANPAAVAGHIGDTLEVMSSVYAHWLPDDRNIPAQVLSDLLKPRLEVVTALEVAR